VADLGRLVRLSNLLIAAVGVLAGGWIALGRVAVPAPLGWAAVAAIGLGAFANVLDDLWDEPGDRVNGRADRPLAAGRVGRGTAQLCVMWGALVGIGASALVGGGAAAAALAALVVMALYPRVLKPRGVAGNLAVAVIAGFPLCFGALAAGRPAAGLVPWTIAAWLHFGREIVKDIVDAPGDRVIGRRTLPIVRGADAARRIAGLALVSAVVASVALPWLTGYRGAYFAAAVPAQLIMLVVAWRLSRAAVVRASGMLKLAMVIGLAALVLGRIA